MNDERWWKEKKRKGKWSFHITYDGKRRNDVKLGPILRLFNPILVIQNKRITTADGSNTLCNHHTCLHIAVFVRQILYILVHQTEIMMTMRRHKLIHSIHQKKNINPFIIIIIISLIIIIIIIIISSHTIDWFWFSGELNGVDQTLPLWEGEEEEQLRTHGHPKRQYQRPFDKQSRCGWK